MSSRIAFHEKCGSRITLGNQRQSASRNYSGSEFDNGLVFSEFFLPERTLFEVVIEKKTRNWSGSLAIGVTKCNPNDLDPIPDRASRLQGGTWVLSGSCVQKDGRTILDDYSRNLEELAVGDRVGVILTDGRALHFHINGEDMGCAAKDVPKNVYVVIDVFGQCCEIKLSGQNDGLSLTDDNVQLTFHPLCGSHVQLANGRRTVFRTNPNEDFNFGVALTSRPLLPNELFEVKIEQVIDKWAGSLEIGVTTHAPGSITLPGTMTNVTSGTWMFSGGAIVQNGITTIESYGRNTVSFKVNDKLGVCVNSERELHFYYNDADLGPVSNNLPECLYAVVDIYGQAVQATIVNSSQSREILPPENAVATTQDNHGAAERTGDNQTTSCMAKFSETHGRLILLNEERTGATRLNALAEFNHAVLISEQPLEDDELFEVVIEEITDRWSGSLEVALLSMAPPDIELPITLTDLKHHCWVVSGSSVMHDGITIVNGYGVDLDKLGVGARVGVMRKFDGTFHVFVNGEDKGTAASFVPPGVFAAFDLYGQCVQLSVVSSPHNTDGTLHRSPSGESLIDESMLDLIYTFNSISGESIAFRNHGHTAVRTRSFNGGLAFTDRPLENESIFEIRIDKLDATWTGSLSVGVTSHVPLTRVPVQISELGNECVYLSGSSVFKGEAKVRGCSVSLDKLKEGSRIGLQLQYDGSLHVFVDSKYKGVVASDLPQVSYGVVDVYGGTQSVSIVNTTNRILSDNFVSSDEEGTGNNPQKPELGIPDLSFHSNCGLNIIMDASCTVAKRKARFSDGLVFSRKPLTNNEIFLIRVDAMNSSWSGSLAVGVLSTYSLEKLNLPASASSIRSNCCVLVHGSQIYINGNKTDMQFPYNFDDIREGDKVAVICDDKSRVHIIVNNEDKGFVDYEVSSSKYAMFDLYGRCEQVSVVPCNNIPLLKTGEDVELERENEKIVKEERIATSEKSEDKFLPCGNCDYKKRCEQFRTTLGIPEQYFTKAVVCYCANCCDARDENRSAVCGDPPHEYTRPFGWCKFELRLPPNLDSCQTLEKNHLAYHVVHVGSIRRTLDRGTLLPPRKNNHIITGHGDKKIIVSPSITRATALTKEKKFYFTNASNGKRSSIQVAFEIRLPSEGYTKTTPNSENDLHSRDWCLEYPTKIVLSGLLVEICEDDR